MREALALHGLTPPAEMALAIRSGNWERAARCFQALALGVSDKALLQVRGGRGRGWGCVRRARVRLLQMDGMGRRVSTCAHASSAAPRPQLFADGSGGGAGALDAGRLAGLSLGAEGARQAATVAAMLDEHARNPDASYVEGLEPLDGIAAAAAAAAADANGAQADSSDDEAAAAAEQAAYDPVDWEQPLAAGAGGSAAGPEAAAGWEGEDGAAGGGGAAGSSNDAFVGAAERQRLASVAELGLRFAEAAAENGHEGACVLPVLGLCRIRSSAAGPWLQALPTCPLPWSQRLLPTDAARSALGVLVRSAHLLPPALAEQLVFRMGQCRMTGAPGAVASAVSCCIAMVLPPSADAARHPVQRAHAAWRVPSPQPRPPAAWRTRQWRRCWRLWWAACTATRCRAPCRQQGWRRRRQSTRLCGALATAPPQSPTGAASWRRRTPRQRQRCLWPRRRRERRPAALPAL